MTTQEKKIEIDEGNPKFKTTKTPEKSQNFLDQENMKPMAQDQIKKTDKEYFHILKDNEDIDTIVKVIMGQNGNDFTCKVCDRTKPQRTHMVWHIETHIGGTSYECHICKKASRTRGNLMKHVYKSHGKEFIKGMINL